MQPNISDFAPLELALGLLLAWLAHEFGHWLALRSLGLRGRLHNRWLLGVALEVPPECQGWRESYVALAGPAANLLLLAGLPPEKWPQVWAANLVVSAVNLLPFLPLDGGKVLRGLFSGWWSWLGCSRFLLLWGKGLALAFAAAVYYFGLRRWLWLLAAWLYLLAWREEQNLPYLLKVRLAACLGQRLRPKRRIRLNRAREWRLYQLIERFSPGWHNFVRLRSGWQSGDELVEKWLAGAGRKILK